MSLVMVLAVVMCFPINVYPLRVFIETLVAPDAEYARWRHWSLVLLIIGVSYGVSSHQIPLV